jgi:3,4-dihydroxy 2-butanone 4-phosphate synthase/GTP cyclohydrolase II
LGVKEIRLITNNPRKIAGLKGYGLEVVDRVPLLIESNDYNSGYLATKAEKLGHLLLQTYLITIAIDWQAETPSVKEGYAKLEKLRHLSRSAGLLLQEEVRPVAVALFGQSSLMFHLGFEQRQMIAPNWYQNPKHPYLLAIASILDELVTWPHLKRLEFLISSGDDPMLGLQVQLDRHTFPLSHQPSQCCLALQTQTIYSFTV